MLTADRRPFVAQALNYFARQDYANRELIIVDDGTDNFQDLIPPDERVRYMQLEKKKSLGSKRNLACEEARGDIIVHWDDDDWMSNWRLTYQVENLGRLGADACGLNQLLFYDLAGAKAWQYTHTGGKPWVSGNTLCYTKGFGGANPFPDVNVGEDTRFLWTSRGKRIMPLVDKGFYVALIHSRNTSAKNPRGAYWRPYPADEVCRLVGGDLACYPGQVARAA